MVAKALRTGLKNVECDELLLPEDCLKRKDGPDILGFSAGNVHPLYAKMMDTSIVHARF